MKVDGNDYRTVWMEGKEVKLIDQTLLPHKFEIYTCKNHEETAEAIKTMIVRGAGAIGATAAYGVAQATLEANENNFNNYILNTTETIKNTRPTAQNLFTGINFVLNSIRNISNLNEIQKIAVKKANEFADYDVMACKKIGEYIL